MIVLRGAHVMHWAGWERSCLLCIPCESRTDKGIGSHCERHAELLNRIVSVGTDSDGRRSVRIEPDIRHVELVLRNLGLEGSKSKPLTTSGFKVDGKELAFREKEVPLDSCYEVQELCHEAWLEQTWVNQ